MVFDKENPAGKAGRWARIVLVGTEFVSAPEDEILELSFQTWSKDFNHLVLHARLVKNGRWFSTDIFQTLLKCFDAFAVYEAKIRDIKDNSVDFV